MMINTPPKRPRRSSVTLNKVVVVPVPVQAGLTILSVVRNGSSSYALTFSGTPTLISTPTPNGGFAVNGQPPSSLYAPSGNQIFVSYSTVGSGLPWTVTAQPNWLAVPIAFPQSGVTS